MTLKVLRAAQLNIEIYSLRQWVGNINITANNGFKITGCFGLVVLHSNNGTEVFLD